MHCNPVRKWANSNRVNSGEHNRAKSAPVTFERPGYVILEAACVDSSNDARCILLGEAHTALSHLPHVDLSDVVQRVNA